MNKSILLLKTMLTSSSHLNIIKNSKDKKKKRRSILALFGLVYLGIIFGGLIGFMAYGMASFNQGPVVPILVASIISLLTLILTLFKSNSYIYSFKQYDLLISMPFSIKTIVSNRFLLMYIKDLPTVFLLSLSALVGYASAIHPSFYLCFSWIILTPFIPLLPAVIATLFGFIIANIGARVKHKKLIQTILTFIFVIPMFFLNYIINYVFKNNEIQDIVDKSAVSLNYVSKVIPSVNWFGKAVNDKNILCFVLLILVSLIIYIAVVYLISENYRKINSILSSSGSHKRVKANVKDFKQKSIINSICFKEFKRITGSTVCATNIGMGAIMALLFTIILPFVNLQKIIASAYTNGELVNIRPLALVFPLLVYFFIGMVPSTASSMSLEGKNYWILKSMPIDNMSIYKGKMLFNIYMNMIPSVLAVISGMFAFRASFIEYIIGIVMIVVLCLFSTTFGMRCGIKHMRLDWDNEVEVVKQGSANTTYILPNLFSSMILMSGMGALVFIVDGRLIALGIIFIYSILTVLAYLAVKRLAKKF